MNRPVSNSVKTVKAALSRARAGKPQPEKPLPYVEIPEFKDTDSVLYFDRRVFENNPGWECFVRRCLPTELQFGYYSRLCPEGSSLFAAVHWLRPGVHAVFVLVAPATANPANIFASGDVSVVAAAVEGLKAKEDHHANN